ncbi:MAG: Asp23/Gls24 family envelope stress response protein [Chloroflexi bacterium]|nr:Asp23/Gls24 family envelope stress response protein [Chloroflexota bacterium]
MSEQPAGRITVDPRVLLTIVRFTALQEPGVARLGRRMPRWRPVRWHGKRARTRGLAIYVVNGQVTVDLHVIADGTVNAQELGRQLQEHVADALEEMVGMPVAGVRVVIEDVERQTRSVHG